MDLVRALTVKYGERTLADLEKMKQSGQREFEMTIPNITLHWIRHAFCTILYLAGVDVVQASAQMGHADVSTTLKIYTYMHFVIKRTGKIEGKMVSQTKSPSAKAKGVV